MTHAQLPVKIRVTTFFFRDEGIRIFHPFCEYTVKGTSFRSFFFFLLSNESLGRYIAFNLY